MSEFACLADAFRYPKPDLKDVLESYQARFPEGAVKSSYSEFISRIRPLSLSQWEELYTQTLDLNPIAAPYLGFQIWGETYQRGELLARLNQAMWEARVDLEGELPDHVVPVLRFLNIVSQPIPELLEILQPAFRRMQGVLSSNEPGNPYIYLFEAVLQAIKMLPESGPIEIPFEEKIKQGINE